MTPTPGDVVRRVLPIVTAGFAAAVALGIALGRAIDNATRSIGQR